MTKTPIPDFLRGASDARDLKDVATDELLARLETLKNLPFARAVVAKELRRRESRS